MNEIKTDKYHLMQCDCLEYMATVPYKQFELAIIDPDFGLNDKISQGGTWASKYKVVHDVF